jgi:hypothetical protein
MKLITLSLVALSLIALSCGSSRTGTTTTTTTTAHEARTGAPVAITTTFTSQYPTATNVIWAPYEQVAAPIDWEMTGWTTMDAGDYVVQFEMDGQKYVAWYDASGDWIGSAVPVSDHGTLPAAVRDMLSTKYSGYAIDKVQKEFEKSRTLYEIKLKKTDDDKIKLLVDEQGNVIKEKLKD